MPGLAGGFAFPCLYLTSYQLQAAIQIQKARLHRIKVRLLRWRPGNLRRKKRGRSLENLPVHLFHLSPFLWFIHMNSRVQTHTNSNA